MKEFIKPEVLEAMRTTLKEYEEETHRTTLTTCQLCLIYHEKSNCYSCPMAVFFDTNGHTYPCMNRKCRPVACKSDWYPPIRKTDIRLQAVIEFYKLAIEHVETLTDDDLKGYNPFNFLVDIDESIAKTHKLLEYV